MGIGERVRAAGCLGFVLLCDVLFCDVLYVYAHMHTLRGSCNVVMNL